MTGGVIKKLLRCLAPHKWLLVAGFLCAAISAVAQLFAPIVIGKAVDCAVGVNDVDFDKITIYTIALGIIIICVLAFNMLMNICVQRAAYLSVRDARNRAFSAITDAPLKYVDGVKAGDVTARLSVDADQIADGLVQGATQLFMGITAIVGTLVLMIRINGWIALAVATITPLSLFVSYLIAKGSHKYFALQNSSRGAVFDSGKEAIENHDLIAAYGYETKAKEQFEVINDELTSSGFKATFYSSLVNPSTRLINSVVYAVAAVMGAIFAVNGAMSVGSITTLLLFANQFARPLNEITSVVTEFQTSLAAAKRVFDLTEIAPQDMSGKDAALNGDIEIKDMSFSYNKENPLIEHLNLSVKSGMLVAIVGKTGCGKTTLINLLMRFYDPDSGDIQYDDLSYKDVSRKAVRNSFGMVLQDSWIFKGSVKDNISYGKPDATQEEIIAAAKKAHIHNFISRLPNGYDTVIDNDDGISQGQKQLINIARIFLSNPPMLILDEATSNIDTRTEKKVQQAFDELLHPKNEKPKTGFVVAHRLSTIINADTILVMDGGKIIESGTHAELIKKNGAYTELYNAQFAK